MKRQWEKDGKYKGKYKGWFKKRYKIIFDNKVAEEVFNLLFFDFHDSTTLTKAYKKVLKDDPKRRCPDIAKVKRLNWKPKVDLETGLLKTIEYFKLVNSD